MTYLRSYRAWLLSGLMFALVAGPQSALAEAVIQKVANKSLAGAAYARLRNLTYDQCAARCLKDPQCVAIEHHRGGGVVRRSSNCALFSSVTRTAESTTSDIGYKRVASAAANGDRTKRSARPVAPRESGAAPGGGAGQAPAARRLESERAGPAAPVPAPGAAPPRPSAPPVPRASEIAPVPQPRVAAPPPPPPVAAAPAPGGAPRPLAEAERRQAEEVARQQAAEASRRYAEASRRQAEEAARRQAAESSRQYSESSRRADEAARRQAEEASRQYAEASRRQAEETARRRSFEASRQPDAAPRAATRSVPPPPVAAAPPPAAPPQPAADEKFHIVPVFYGTDRNQIRQDGRIGYANDRAKRLEMGRALVSVPLNHKVPNIERPRAWTIPYFGTIQLEKEDPSKHFTVREIRTLTKAELIDLVRQRLGASQTFKNQSIVFIHGYNMGFDHALYRTAQIGYDLQFDGAAFAYSWPSGGGLSSYIYDRDSAQAAERYLYEFLQMVQNETGSTQINIIAHSMGNQMLLQVLRSLKLRSPDTISRINQIILASPDVDRDAFESLAAEITGIAKGITLYAAANDRALEASRLVAGNKPRAGDVPDEGPVIISGIDTIDITRVSTAYLALHHSGYAESSDLLTDIGQIIRAGTRPWSQRLKAYKPVNLPAGTYWRYEQ